MGSEEQRSRAIFVWLYIDLVESKVDQDIAWQWINVYKISTLSVTSKNGVQCIIIIYTLQISVDIK